MASIFFTDISTMSEELEDDRTFQPWREQSKKLLFNYTGLIVKSLPDFYNNRKRILEELYPAWVGVLTPHGVEVIASRWSEVTIGSIIETSRF
jgi:hypothetical protein